MHSMTKARGNNGPRKKFEIIRSLKLLARILKKDVIREVAKGIRRKV